MATPFRIEVNSSTGQARADITGLFNNIADLTKKISANPVDWQKILFSTLTPAALVGDLGRTLQLAVDATIDFENAVGTAAANAAGNFTGNTKLIGDMALNMTQNLGTATGDNAQSIAYLSKTWGDNLGVMSTIMDRAAEANNTGLARMSDAVQIYSQVLQAWGVTSAQDAAKAIDAIVSGVQNGNIHLEKFAATLIQSKAGLSQYHVSVTDAAAALSALSDQVGITGDQAVSIFSNFANVINTKTNPAGHALLDNAKGILPALQEGNVIDALTNMEKYFQKGGTEAAQIGIQANVNSDNIQKMEGVTVTSIDNMNKKAHTLATSMKQDLTDPLGQALTASQQLSVSFNQFVSDFMAGPGDLMLNFVNNLIQAADVMLRLTSGQFATAVVQHMQDQTNQMATQTQSEVAKMFQQAGVTGAGAQSVLTHVSNILQGTDIGKLGILQNALLYPSQSNISTINNTFGINISVTAGETSSQISNAIVKALYARFQGVGK
jgi:hypothetical protein